ncbi:MAG: dockerin type I repeat-containing protein, partial [Oscillospiraceae bacterium]|nr:dockerin type I repeat-containing protein [Oscillospiraceae bacterium]
VSSETAPASETTVTTVTTVTTASETVSETTTTAVTAPSVTSETEPAAALAGDVNCSGGVDVSDAVLLARFVAEDAVNITAAGKQNADCDGTAGIDSNDVIHILKIIAKLV